MHDKVASYRGIIADQTYKLDTGPAYLHRLCNIIRSRGSPQNPDLLSKSNNSHYLQRWSRSQKANIYIKVTSQMSSYFFVQIRTLSWQRDQRRLAYWLGIRSYCQNPCIDSEFVPEEITPFFVNYPSGIGSALSGFLNLPSLLMNSLCLFIWSGFSILIYWVRMDLQMLLFCRWSLTS